MDFNRLPDTAFMKIFDYLPLEDRVRVGRVNKPFRRIAQLAISQTKSLDLTEDRFENLNADQLAVILDLCSPNLERIKFHSHGASSLISTLANYGCPRLIDIDLGQAPVRYSVFDRLVRNNPRLESLYWRGEFIGFPTIVSNNLKKLDLGVVEEAGLNSLIGRCPNLIEFRMVSRDITDNILDMFFASVPHLQKLDLQMWNEMLDDDDGSVDVDNERVDNLVSIWYLPLVSLSLSFSEASYPGDSVLHKVATSFPNLKKFHMDAYMTSATNDGVSELSALKELEILDFTLHHSDEDGYDEGICQLVACKHLRQLKVWRKINSATLIALLRSCPKLEYIFISDIDQVDTPEEAAVIFESLAGIAKRNITIDFYGIIFDKDRFMSIWDSDQVKTAIKNLDEIEGFKIKINWNGFLEIE